VGNYLDADALKALTSGLIATPTVAPNKAISSPPLGRQKEQVDE
jgi:hypothetical protein